MHCFGPGNHAFGKGAGTAQDKIIAAQIQALHGKWVEGEVWLVMFGDQRKLLHERGANIHFLKSRVNTLRVINGGVDRRVGEHLVKSNDNAFCTSHLIEVVMN